MRSKRKFNKTKEWLIEEYIVKNCSRKEIALECGLTESGLKSILIEFQVSKEKFECDKNKLKELVNNGLSAKEIANDLNCDSTTIYRYLNKYKLVILAKTKKADQYNSINDSDICSLYLSGKSSTEIAKIFEITHNTVLTHLEHNNIKRRNYSESQWLANNRTFPSDLKNYEKVYNLYITQKLSKKEIGKLYNCSTRVIDRVLRKFKILVRNQSTARIGLYIGEKHPNWKGGVTGLHYRLREAFYLKQVPNVLRRDQYQCQLCYSKKHLQVHHKKHFKDILHKILESNSNLDPVKDQDQLYELALQDKDFLDLDNLITYCKECHLFKIHGYKKKKEKLQALHKSPELLETPKEDNQQPSLKEEGSETISKESTPKQVEVGDIL